MSSRGTDFFISHAGRDTAWAEWLAWQLQQAGYTVELDVWNWAPGEDFVARLYAALERADRILAVCTEAYFASAFGGAELRAAFAGSAANEGRIVPVLVEPVTLPPLYAPLIRLDLIGLDETEAAARLQTRLAGVRPTGPPPFPRRDAVPDAQPGFPPTEDVASQEGRQGEASVSRPDLKGKAGPVDRTELLASAAVRSSAQDIDSPRGLRVFYSYSHKDERYREALEAHLRLLQREGLIESWQGRKIAPGEDWRSAIKDKLSNADIILLLVSADFMASDFPYEEELLRAMARHEAGEALVVPIIVRAVDWHRSPIGKLQAFTEGRKADHDVEKQGRGLAERGAGDRSAGTRLPARLTT